MNEDVEIYKKLKMLRKERGLTLATLADRIGTDYQQLSRIERGKSKLTVDVLMKIADAFNTPIDHLVRGKPAKELSVQPTVPEPCVREDQLTEILEKLERIAEEQEILLNPKAKAALASLIYRHALKSDQALDFAMGILRALFEARG